MPDWIRNAVFWHVYPLGFLGAERDAGPQTPVTHRLRRLEPWLDYAADLGASGLMLGPIFASSTHGYDTLDHFRIDPRLGDDADFDALAGAAKARGMRLVLDGVFNHLGRGHPAFTEVLAQGRSAPRADWFRLSWPRGDGPGQTPDYATFEGHGELPALDHDNPAVADLVADVMTHWLRRGADGFRLDAAYAVPTRFWATVMARVRTACPDAYVFGEVIHGDYAGFVREARIDATTQYELWKAIWSAIVDQNFFELAWAMTRHEALLDTFVPQTFLGNHDVTRLASRIVDERHVAHAVVILFTCAGTPSIYAGDEQGFRGFKEDRPGGDDDVRPAFPETPDGLAPYGWPMHELHRSLIALRRLNPWLHAARTRSVALANHHMVYETRGAGGESLTVALNLSDRDITETAPGAARVIAGAATLGRSGTAKATVTLPPHGWAILAP
ncbi:alpha-amylase family glycosyl hydrolase [Rhodoplanes roseus]|uniref:alpha-amylase family glycosyl hydrolase n=1 Tax=Rhodoplanes roseus TaxID=29409 RepID=UPI0014730F2B|nr:alpha-amylase family glycosyl hydrolase [Rhodoplanes roseus]